MKLSQPYYIEKRKGLHHISLNGKWDFCWTDREVVDPSALDFAHSATLPCSVYHALFEAGVLPDPYVATNSKRYHWVDEKVWYFRRGFVANAITQCGNAYLCFDGVSYDCRVWVNGRLLGEHAGMFGGPCCDIKAYLHSDDSNEVVVEVKACNFGKKEGYDFWNTKGENSAIVPWNIIRDTVTSNGDFIAFGIWNDVRIELLPEIHISRPYLVTKKIEDDLATLHFEVELTDGSIPELRPYFGANDGCCDYTRAYDTGLTGAVRERYVEIEIVFSDAGKRVYYSREKVPLTDFAGLGMDETYWELQCYQKEILLQAPKLWYPNGIGEPFLYDVSVSLFVDGVMYDSHDFRFGVRSFTADYTHGNKYRHRWDKFLFSVNGKEFFLKGMNWTPIDFLYDVSPERYEWCLTLVKNAGIQLLRVWNGGGIPERDVFYELCDRMGIMVWQDQYISNTIHTDNYPQDIMECQTAYNLYRIRNHPSLVILCGGNEFNPYAPGNAASLFVIQRTVQTLAPDRVYYHTTSDQGSAHIYLDMEPVWYRHRYKQLPFLAESGIHSFPSFTTIKKLVRPEEHGGAVCDLSSPTFQEDFPDLINHMSEYHPERVPRMMARNSQITDLSKASLEAVCEASQVQVYEFYQLMIQSMQENFPVCGGIMPWVFKRPWATVGVQTVDGDDRPSYAYYAVQNAYKPINVCWCQQWSVLAPFESIPLQVKIFNQNNEDLSNTVVTLKVFAPDLTVFEEHQTVYRPVCDFGICRLTESFIHTCFLVSVDVSRNGVSLARSVYFNKCTELLENDEIYRTKRSMPTENMYFKNGPWLKTSVMHAKHAILEASIIKKGFDGTYHYADVLVKNSSDTPAFPVTLEPIDAEKRCYLSENFFLLESKEEKIIRMTVDAGEVDCIKINLWNGNALVVT